MNKERIEKWQKLLSAKRLGSTDLDKGLFLEERSEFDREIFFTTGVTVILVLIDG
jgi:hypothetical protein